jgi:competence protein ComEA
MPARFHFPPMKLLRRLLVLLLIALLPQQAFAQVDINHADAKTLAESLNGVGLVKADAIVAYRESHGPFLHIDDLVAVNGIGERTIEANREAIVIVVENPPMRGGGSATKGP